MSDSRKYREDEVKEILDLAVRRNQRGEGEDVDGLGMSLAELQDVGREVGLDPESIAEAAMAVESRRGILPRRTFLKIPVVVGRIVELPRAPTDEEWRMLVTELQYVFSARGRVASYGGVREWRNGNLYATIESTTAGHRLRLGTRKGDADAVSRISVGAIGTAALLVLVEVIASALGSSVLDGSILTLRGASLPLMLAGMGLGALVFNSIRLPNWARAREGQMEHIAGAAGSILAESSSEIDDSGS